MRSIPLSIFIITKNEADRLGRTLSAVRDLGAELIVVDSGSTDGTEALAEGFGARVIRHDFAGYGPQKRFAEEQCVHDWLLNLDADEVVPPKLAAEIAAVFEKGEPDVDAYTVPIAEVFPGESVPHAFAYTLKPVRLYRRSKGRYANSIVHDRVALLPGAIVGALKVPIHHFSIRSIGDQIDKLNAYTDQQVRDLAEGGKSVPGMAAFRRISCRLLEGLYPAPAHPAGGRYGFMTAMNFAFYRWLRIAKDVERRRLQKKKDAA